MLSVLGPVQTIVIKTIAIIRFPYDVAVNIIIYLRFQFRLRTSLVGAIFAVCPVTYMLLIPLGGWMADKVSHYHQGCINPWPDP